MVMVSDWKIRLHDDINWRHFVLGIKMWMEYTYKIWEVKLKHLKASNNDSKL